MSFQIPPQKKKIIIKKLCKGRICYNSCVGSYSILQEVSRPHQEATITFCVSWWRTINIQSAKVSSNEKCSVWPSVWVISSPPSWETNTESRRPFVWQRWSEAKDEKDGRLVRVLHCLVKYRGRCWRWMALWWGWWGQGWESQVSGLTCGKASQS